MELILVIIFITHICWLTKRWVVGLKYIGKRQREFEQMLNKIEANEQAKKKNDQTGKLS